MAGKMDSSVFKKAVRVSPFFVLVALSVGGFFHFSSAEFFRNALRFKDLPGTYAYRPQISVICPPTAYEFETVQLTVVVRHSDGVGKPLRFSIEAPAEIEVQGSKERQVSDSESWFLLPKEQGEYVVVVHSIAEARLFSYEHHLSVRRLDGLTRNQFNILMAFMSLSGLVGIIGTVRGWFAGSSKKQ
jgi:hypothetical protein